MRRPASVEEAAAKATEDMDSRFVFDAGKPPPFRIGDVRAAVPPHCWRKSPWRSLSYVARDVAVVAGLAVADVLHSVLAWVLAWVLADVLRMDNERKSVTGEQLEMTLMWRKSRVVDSSVTR